MTPITPADVLLILSLIAVLLVLLITDSNHYDREEKKTPTDLERSRYKSREEINREHRGRP